MNLEITTFNSDCQQVGQVIVTAMETKNGLVELIFPPNDRSDCPPSAFISPKEIGTYTPKSGGSIDAIRRV